MDSYQNNGVNQYVKQQYPDFIDPINNYNGFNTPYGVQSDNYQQQPQTHSHSQTNNPQPGIVDSDFNKFSKLADLLRHKAEYEQLNRQQQESNDSVSYNQEKNNLDYITDLLSKFNDNNSKLRNQAQVKTSPVQPVNNQESTIIPIKIQITVEVKVNYG